MSAPTATVRRQMLTRDGSRCIRCGVGIYLEAQHRQAVGMGGSKHRPSIVEVVTACSECNARFESDLQQAALRFGWKVRGWVAEPGLVPVFEAWSGWWFLLLSDASRVCITRGQARELMQRTYGPAYDPEKGLVG